MTDEVEADRQRRIQHIQNLYAFELFQQHRFEESAKMFAKLGTGRPFKHLGVISIVFTEMAFHF